MSVIIDGKKIALTIREESADEVKSLAEQGIIPHLAVVLVGENPASQVYVRMKEKACAKAGISSETITYPETITEAELLDTVNRLNRSEKVHGILVQLPLPIHIQESRIIEAISPNKDVDGFHPINIGKLASGLTDGFVSATPAGIIELLMRSNNDPSGKHVVIVGRSNIVGKPVAYLLLRKTKGGNATVTVCHSKTNNLGGITYQADILVAATGKPEMIRKSMVKPGAVVIDVGVNRVEDPDEPKGYRLVGDVDFTEVSKTASAITPVPGGVGPMTIAMLLKNTIQAAKSIASKKES
jgi:methylenetetrahydrofolate dehydrogenase (NADP+)/methenyltetrahydrofolate cyclohydrolase